MFMNEASLYLSCLGVLWLDLVSEIYLHISVGQLLVRVGQCSLNFLVLEKISVISSFNFLVQFTVEDWTFLCGKSLIMGSIFNGFITIQIFLVIHVSVYVFPF